MTVQLLQPGTFPYPSCCCSCGSTDYPVIDWGVTKPYDGAVLVCTNCLKHYIETYGIGIRTEKVAQIEQDFLDRNELRVVTSERLLQLERGINATLADFASSIRDTKLDNSASDSPVESSEQPNAADLSVSWLDEETDEFASQ
jgi:hypothetical protein